MHAPRVSPVLLLCILYTNLPSIVVHGQFVAPRLCDNIDLSAFCIIDNHFKKMVIYEWSKADEQDELLRWKYYPQFREILKEIFDDSPWREDEDDNGVRYRRLEDRTTTTTTPASTTTVASSTVAGQSPAAGQPTTPATATSSVAPFPPPPHVLIPRIDVYNNAPRNSSVYSVLDMCDMEEVLYKSIGNSGPAFKDKNPYELSVTEIEVDGTRLHNHLHIEIKSTQPFKYAFVVVNDQDGWAVGDFKTGVYCGEHAGSDCNCKPPDCHQSIVNDTIPCMFTSERAVTHPGQFMYYNEQGVKQLHMTWRFAQSTDPALFVRELHFRSLLIEGVNDHTLERKCEYNYQFYNREERQRCNKMKACSPSSRKGKIGWNAKYTILHPTDKTIGAWDYFHKGFIMKKDVQCHIPISAKFYTEETYPNYNTEITTLAAAKATCKPKSRTKVAAGPSQIVGALASLYSWLSWDSLGQIYFGVPEIEKLSPYLRPQQTVRPLAAEDLKSLENLKNLPTENSLIQDERCYCPRLGTAAPAKDRRIPKKLQLESRKDHAIQMTIAWIVLVPLAIFVSRYYKETYSKVFFLQEYWWFTMHFLCLVLACVFIFGGIYGVEVKRGEPFFVNDPALLAHLIVGGVAIGLFVLQLLFGVFRMRDVFYRKVQIFLHWFFGVLQWLLAIGAMVSAGWVPAGCFSCGFAIVVAVFIIGQIIFFVIMEIQIHRVDKKMKLRPKRRYLPPPIMRVFHMNAPGSKFRIYMLCGYVFFCMVCYAVAHIFIAITPYYGSCFDADPDDTIDRIQVEEIDMILQEEAKHMTTSTGHP